MDRLVWRLYAIAKLLLAASGLARSHAGGRVVASLNRLGCLGSRFLLALRQTPPIIGGHTLFMGDRQSPSLSFSTSMLLNGYERGTTRLLERVVRKNTVVLDVGAHVGYYTLLAARLVGPGGRVYAFEPDLENAALLRRNIAVNGYKNVTAVPKAVTDSTGSIRLYMSSEGNDRHSLYPSRRSLAAEASAEVIGTTLDDFLAGEGWPPVDLIKMDIEGAEPLALRGMQGLLSRSRDLRMIVEFAPGSLRAGGVVPREFLETLLGLGFNVSSIEEDGALVSLGREDFPGFIADLERKGVRNLLCERAVA